MMPSNINIVASEEPLLIMEACDHIIELARAAGVSERKVIDGNERVNWSEILADSSSLSLFAEIKLLDIRFSKMPLKEAQNALIELANAANEENQLLVRFPKLEKRQKSTKWFKSLSKNAHLQELWPPKLHQFGQWLNERAKTNHLHLQPEACQMLAERTEGNLLAAEQTIQKLKLLFPEQSIDLEMVSKITADSARYSVFSCLDEALAGRGDRAVTMLKKFESEMIAPISILVNLSREIELCKNTALAMEKGMTAQQALASSYLWDAKKRLIIDAVHRLPAPVWHRLMMRCAFLDRMVKGQEKGNIWQELELCLWMISGQRIWGPVR